MNNTYLKDIIKYESAYQGIINPRSITNFYSLCRKVFEKASDGPDGNNRMEIYKMVNFSVGEFENFFESLTADEVEYIKDMLAGQIPASVGWRMLQVMFIGSAYKYSIDRQTNHVYTTSQDSCSFTLTIDPEQYTISANLVCNSTSQAPSLDAKITGDLILYAFGDGEY